MKLTEEQKIKAYLNKLSKDRLVELILQLMLDKRVIQAQLDELKKSSKDV